MAEERRWDIENPLGRIKGESQKANIALNDYFRMGPGRSLRKLLDMYCKQGADEGQTFIPPTRKWSTIAGWSFRYHWQKRVAAQTVIDDAERAALWAARRLEVQEADWTMAGKLREVAVKILDEAPLFVKQQRRFIKGEKGKPDQVLITMALNGQLAVQAAQASSKLARLAAEMENERQKIVLAMEKEAETFFDAAQQVLNESDFERLLVRLSGAESGQTAATEDPEQAGAEEE